MATMAAPRKSVSVYDYPEHLNPFHEEDNHNKIRFWTLGRKLQRSNSITFSGIKDLKNSWALRSFLRKGKKDKSSKEKSSSQLNGDNSPIVYRRALQYSTTAGSRSTVGSPERTDRYIYGGSVTPLPRSRFQERLRSSSQYDTSSLSASPRMARSEVTGSRLSVESTNPFDEDPIPPVRASRRKKKRAPLPPSALNAAADVSVTSETSELTISEAGEKSIKTDGDIDLEEMNINVELKIVEDEDVKNKNAEAPLNTETTKEEITVETTVVSSHAPNGIVTGAKYEPKHQEAETQPVENTVKGASSEDDILNSVSFPKVDISKYRRNSSVNEDDIRLRRGNLEDFHLLSNKRSKSLTNALDTTYLTYDINLNENTTATDANGNEEPQKLVCKLYDENSRKQSIDTISSTEKEFMEIDRATRELEREISKLNSALNDEELPSVESSRISVSEIKKRFDKTDTLSPNPIPKPRRSHYGGSSPP